MARQSVSFFLMEGPDGDVRVGAQDKTYSATDILSSLLADRRLRLTPPRRVGLKAPSCSCPAAFNEDATTSHQGRRHQRGSSDGRPRRHDHCCRSCLSAATNAQATSGGIHPRAAASTLRWSSSPTDTAWCEAGGDALLGARNSISASWTGSVRSRGANWHSIRARRHGPTRSKRLREERGVRLAP